MRLNSSFVKICVRIGIVVVTCCLICSQAQNLGNDLNINSGAPYGDIQRPDQNSNFGDILLKVIQKLRQNQTLHSLLSLRGYSLKLAQKLPGQSEALRQYGSSAEYDSDRSKKLRRSVEDDSLQKLSEKTVAPTGLLGIAKKDAKLAEGAASDTETGSESGMLGEQEPESQIPTPGGMGLLQTTSPIKYDTESGSKDGNIDKAGVEDEVKTESVKTTLEPGIFAVISDSQQVSVEPDNPNSMKSTAPANVYLSPTAATRGQQLGPKTTSEQTTFVPKIEKTDMKNSDANLDKTAKKDIRNYNYTNLETVLSGPTSVTMTKLDSEVSTTVVTDENRPGMDMNTMTTVKAEKRMPTDPASVDLNTKTELPKVTTTTSSVTPVSNSTLWQSTEHTMTEPTVTEIVVRTDPPHTTETVLGQPDRTLPKETTTAIITKTIPDDGTILANDSVKLVKTSPGISIVPTKSVSEEQMEEPKRTVRTVSDIRTRTIAPSEATTDSNFFPSSEYIYVTTSVLSPRSTSATILRSSPSPTSRTIESSVSPTVSPFETRSLMPSKTGAAVIENVNSVKSSQSGYTAHSITMTELPKSFVKDQDSIVPTSPVTLTMSYPETRATEQMRSTILVSPAHTSKASEVSQTGKVVTTRTLNTIARSIPVGTTTPSGTLLSTTGWVSDIKTPPSFWTSSSGPSSDFDRVPTLILTASSGIDGHTTLGLSDTTPSVTSRSQTPPLTSFDGTVVETSRFETMSSRLEPSNTLRPTTPSEILQKTLSLSETLISSNMPSNSANIESSLHTTNLELPKLLTKTLSPIFTTQAISSTVTVDSQTMDSSLSQPNEISQTPIISISYSASQPLSTPIFSPSITASSEINTHTELLVPATPIFTNYLSQTTANLETSSSSVLKSVISATPSFSPSDMETTRRISQMAATIKYSSTIPGTMSDISPTRTKTLSSRFIKSSSQSISPTVSQTVVTVSPTVLPPTVGMDTTTASVTVETPGVTNVTTNSPSKSVSPPSDRTTKSPTTVSPPTSTTDTTEPPTTESSTTVAPPSSSTQTTPSPPPRGSNTVPPGGKTTKDTTQNTVTVIVNTTDISKPRNETLSKASMSTTTIIGIAVGSIMGFWIILGPIVCFLCRMKDKAKDRRNRPYDVDDPEEGDLFLRDYVATHLARSRPTNFQNQPSDRYSMDVFTHIENGVMKTEL